MLALGEYIEEVAMYKSDDLVKELAKQKGGLVWVERIENGKAVLTQIPSESLKVGDIVVVGAGDTILVDGHIVWGEALVNQISMTGEATPVQKSKGDKVLSGLSRKRAKSKSGRNLSAHKRRCHALSIILRKRSCKSLIKS